MVQWEALTLTKQRTLGSVLDDGISPNIGAHFKVHAFEPRVGAIGQSERAAPVSNSVQCIWYSAINKEYSSFFRIYSILKFDSKLQVHFWRSSPVFNSCGTKNCKTMAMPSFCGLILIKVT